MRVSYLSYVHICDKICCELLDGDRIYNIVVIQIGFLNVAVCYHYGSYECRKSGSLYHNLPCDRTILLGMFQIKVQRRDGDPNMNLILLAWHFAQYSAQKDGVYDVASTVLSSHLRQVIHVACSD